MCNQNPQGSNQGSPSNSRKFDLELIGKINRLEIATVAYPAGMATMITRKNVSWRRQALTIAKTDVAEKSQGSASWTQKRG